MSWYGIVRQLFHWLDLTDLQTSRIIHWYVRFAVFLQIKSNIYKQWSQLEIERSNLYLELWAKWPKKETYFSLIYVISDTCWFHCLNHKAGPNQTDLISEQVQAGIWEERRANDMTAFTVRWCQVPAQCPESSQLHICWHSRLWWLPDIGFVQCGAHCGKKG